MMTMSITIMISSSIGTDIMMAVIIINHGSSF